MAEEVFEARSRDDSLIVYVGRGGNTLRLAVQDPAMELDDHQLATRIMHLNTLAYMRSQLAMRLEMEGNHAYVSSDDLPTEEQVARFAAMIDF